MSKLIGCLSLFKSGIKDFVLDFDPQGFILGSELVPISIKALSFSLPHYNDFLHYVYIQ